MFYHDPVFVGLVMTSPVWLFAIGTLLRIKCEGNSTRIGRAGIAMQFLAQVTMVIDIIVASTGPVAWSLLFTSVLAFLWLFLLIAVLYGIISNPDEDGEFGIGHFWVIFFATAFVCTAVAGVLWFLWQFILVLVASFNAITSYLG